MEGAKTLMVSRGKKLLRFELGDKENRQEIATVILGRSGTLRAPAIRVDATFLVGFHAEGYAEVFGA